MTIELAKALRSDMEAPKAPNGMESAEGCRQRIFDILFGHRILLLDRKMRFLAFLKFSASGQRGALAFHGSLPPVPS